MSIRIMQWVFENSKSKGTARLIALALADHADQDGKCWPSWARIQQYTNMSRGAIAAGMKVLEELGEIRRDSQAAAHRSNFYYFLKANGPESGPYQKCNSPKTELTTVQNPDLDGSESEHGTVSNRHVEPSKRNAGSTPASFPAAGYMLIEEAFSAAYRAKKEAEGKKDTEWINTSIGAGRKAVRALFLAGLTPEEIAGRVPDYVRSADGRFKRYTLAAFVANFNDTGSGPSDKREEKRAMAADGHWGRR